jgi:tRNA threonylcarbamoyladenosine biosynthesis protein TsaE
VHLDLYRLEQPAAADDLFAQEEEEARTAAASARVVMAVEWPERLSFRPEGAWLLRLEHRGDSRRACWRHS